MYIKNANLCWSTSLYDHCHHSLSLMLCLEGTRSHLKPAMSLFIPNSKEPQQNRIKLSVDLKMNKFHRQVKGFSKIPTINNLDINNKNV